MPPAASSSSSDPPGHLIDRLLLAREGGSGEPQGLQPKRLFDEVVFEDDEVAFVDDEARPKKRTKAGIVKLTKGAAVRKRYSAKEQLQAIDAHTGAVALGASRTDVDGKAAGTKVPYVTLYKWTRPAALAAIRVRAVAETKHKLFKAR
jgi:hypothetical protein